MHAMISSSEPSRDRRVFFASSASFMVYVSIDGAKSFRLYEKREGAHGPGSVHHGNKRVPPRFDLHGLLVRRSICRADRHPDRTRKR